MISTLQDTVAGANTEAIAVPKLLGFDVEVGNALYGPAYTGGTGDQASLLLLAAFEGSANPTSAASTGYGSDSTLVSSGSSLGGYRWGPPANCQDWGRKFLPSNGGCAYIDLSHLEICAAEVLSARDYTAMWFAMVTKVSEAVDRVNAGLKNPNRVRAFVNNSDGQDHSYGGHLDIMLSRQCYENLFAKRLHYQLFLASHFASAMIYTGQGKVGAENGQSHVGFQLSQRADFTEVICGPQTTHRRPIVNSRAEHLVGVGSSLSDSDSPAARYARLHIIFFDSTLTEVSVFLRAGTTSLVTAMIEQQQVDSSLILDDPVAAVLRWSHGGPRAEAALASGARYSAMDMQEALLERAARFVDEGRAEGFVPGAAEVVARWAQVLGLLREDDIDELARHCDWALKYMLLDRAISRRGLDWTSPEIKQLDLLFSSVTPGDGLCWGYRQRGLLEQVLGKGDIERFVHEPPEDTRAWLRANLLRVVPDEMVAGVNWDVMRFRLPSPDGFWDRWTLRMDDPLGYAKAQCEGLFEDAGSVRDLLLALGARPAYGAGATVTTNTRRGAWSSEEALPERDDETEDADVVYEDD